MDKVELKKQLEQGLLIKARELQSEAIEGMLRVTVEAMTAMMLGRNMQAEFFLRAARGFADAAETALRAIESLEVSREDL